MLDISSNQDKKEFYWYVGSIEDLRRRIEQDKNNNNFYSIVKGPFDVLYCESYEDEQGAIEREKYLNSSMGQKLIEEKLKYFRSLEEK